MASRIQTCGGYNPTDGYSFSISFGDGPLMTLDGLEEEDIYEIASCVLCLLPEEKYQELIQS
jgi:hypothetical protein